eukprot:scaffold248417_cov67-Attheya_sp.AAC.4
MSVGKWRRSMLRHSRRDIMLNMLTRSRERSTFDGMIPRSSSAFVRKTCSVHSRCRAWKTVWARPPRTAMKLYGRRYSEKWSLWWRTKTPATMRLAAVPMLAGLNFSGRSGQSLWNAMA